MNEYEMLSLRLLSSIAAGLALQERPDAGARAAWLEETGAILEAVKSALPAPPAAGGQRPKPEDD